MPQPQSPPMSLPLTSVTVPTIGAGPLPQIVVSVRRTSPVEAETAAPELADESAIVERVRRETTEDTESVPPPAVAEHET